MPLVHGLLVREINEYSTYNTRSADAVYLTGPGELGAQELQHADRALGGFGPLGRPGESGGAGRGPGGGGDRKSQSSVIQRLRGEQYHVLRLRRKILKN